MSDLELVWRFTRQRLAQSLEGLSDSAIRWRQHHCSHTIGEILYHVAGAEHYWGTRILESDPNATELGRKLERATYDGFLRDGACPFGESEMTLGHCLDALNYTEEQIRAVFATSDSARLQLRLTSPIGDPVTVREGLARLAQHAGYHTGQVWMIRTHPDFPG